ncbi:hypothetical protein COT97_01255 [Candidatus Falkowbacteria bacterium CG10_big_fil_rev_8_21_14_0_10_39_11]|uniref:Tyrosine recombinase XerC n=1 Tax=Candidatus Falkowbacteria bacterium CG10_big_fil_rev_8_21_14_0_10_39_11 TaxID=1974565 RepID=A0A2H0V5W8_9BACT|nr:MAG: hypothetical protein COT97_01255 [Candidatus Falkowbacteria bacterium CG10_big_fil_rev_8_21_14_0_10_39_11]
MGRTKIENQITNFLEDLEVTKGRTSRTIRNYDFYLRRFASWLKEQKVNSPDKLNLELIRKYRLWLNRLRDNKKEILQKSTQNYHLIAIRSFLKYLAKHDIESLVPEKVELARLPERQVAFLEGSDLDSILEAPLKTDTKKVIKFRDKAILELFFSTGMRVSELAGLQRDINLKKDELSIRGKGGKIRVVFISKQARYWITEYLKLRKDKNPFLFIGHDKAAEARDKEVIEAKDYIGLTPRSIERTVQKYAKIIGINKKVTPHTLRHSFATDLLMNGADIRSVQSMLGHSSINTTQIYTHITDQQLRDVHSAFHGTRRDSKPKKNTKKKKR